MSELADLFARFRRDHARGARVPKDLRAAALAAVKSGVSIGDLYRSCGVSWSQLVAWKASAPATAAPPAATDKRARRRTGVSSTKAVRVFSVVDAPAPLTHGPELELRLGAWSVSVRLAGGGHAEGK